MKTRSLLPLVLLLAACSQKSSDPAECVCSCAPPPPPPPAVTVTAPCATEPALIQTIRPDGTPPPPTPSTKGPSPIEQARAAGLRGDSLGVRRVLEASVRAGHGTPEEAMFVKQACKEMKDKVCVDDIRVKYPNL